MADYTYAIDLREKLRAQLGEAWSAPLQNDLASAYNNRGNAHWNQGALEAAIADYDRAIDLREGLRAQWGDAWSAPLQNDLAMAYANRGEAHQKQEALDAAVKDYQWAIARWDSLRTVLEPQGNWPTAWQGYLDETQENYQTVIDALKD
jgi:tetratricopeptide (TPR) repeat protein